MPDLMAGARVDGPDVIGHSHVKDAIDEQRRALKFVVLAGLEGPGESELLNVLRRDLRQARCGAGRSSRRDNRANCQRADSASAAGSSPWLSSWRKQAARKERNKVQSVRISFLQKSD